jgi:hypothetical protein
MNLSHNGVFMDNIMVKYRSLSMSREERNEIELKYEAVSYGGVVFSG